MKNKAWIIIAVILVLVIALAAVMYPKLSERYSADRTSEKSKSTAVVKTDDFTVYDSEMNKVKLSDYFGKPIVVNFWASWCSPCKSELPAFDDAYKKYNGDVVFLMVNLTDGYRETTDSIKKFVSDNGYSFPVYYDLDYNASETYGIYSIPETLFINADGTLCDTRVGALNDVVLEDYINRMIGESK